jgi:hypothetical protein
LLADRDWLAGLGGFLDGGGRSVVEVTAPNRTTLYVDPFRIDLRALRRHPRRLRPRAMTSNVDFQLQQLRPLVGATITALARTGAGRRRLRPEYFGLVLTLPNGQQRTLLILSDPKATARRRRDRRLTRRESDRRFFAERLALGRNSAFMDASPPTPRSPP